MTAVRMTKVLTSTFVLWLLGSVSMFAQQTTGNIAGRVTDQQGGAIPGASVTAKSAATGFVRNETSDAEGLYRLNALPVGTYDVTVDLQGFATVVNTGIDVNVAQTQTVDTTLKVAAVRETVTVSGAAKMIETTASSVGQVVDPHRVLGLPLNGRQFANLAATIPGVGLGFHSDPTHNTQYAPLINGGAGRNVNYQIDGGDNNDDTVGGLLQLFPLEAIQEFTFITQRFKAENGRSNGGVMNVVTKSGTNVYQGSFFELFRDKGMNAVTEAEKLAVLGTTNAPVKGNYRRHQFGGSFGGPIARDTAHFFAAYERTQQDKTQTVNTRGLFPGLDGTFPVQFRENLATAKVVANLSPTQYLSVRYGRNDNSSPYGASPINTPDNWGDSTNSLNSVNLNHNWVLGGSKLNEFVFQFADFRNHIESRSKSPFQQFPNGTQTGGSLNAPQTTEQRKYQFRNDFSWHVTKHGGLGHDFKAGVNFINEPRLFVTFNVGKDVVAALHLTNELAGPLQVVMLKQAFPVDSTPAANVPNRQYGFYFQDDWRIADRLTINAGIRYDLVTGVTFDQSTNPNFVKVQQAAASGAFASLATPVREALSSFALPPRSDRNNIQPRIGAAWDVRGNGRDVVRAGWGIYTDFGHLTSNVLQAAIDASGARIGNVFVAQSTTGLRNPDGSFYLVGQPLANLASLNQVAPGSQPLQGFWSDPRLQEPYQIQTNLGWSHEFTADTVVSVDYVNSLGRDLNYRPRLNQLVPGTTVRRISAVLSSALSPNNSSNRPALSIGESRYNALILGARRRLSRRVDFSASYMFSNALSTIGNASDEVNTANIQNPDDPFHAAVQMGPNATVDARHRVNMSAVLQLPLGLHVAPFFLYRSALPINLIDGRDLNRDGDALDLPSEAFGADTFDAATGRATIKSLGACTTVNCGRGYAQSQFNLRVSKIFQLVGRANVEAIGEMYNVFNALNPASANRTVVVPTTGARNPALLQPQSFSGDFQRPEQRIGQVGFRFSF